jgi:uncharacterized membrane protein YphA (DoxX/SURF4 family)
MWHILMRIIIGVLLIIHGFAHWEITSAWGSKESETSWLLVQVGAFDTVLWAVTLVGFILAGIAVFIGLRLWRALAIASAILSLVTMALFWHFSMIIGAVVDGGILFALLWARWPQPNLVGP